MKKDFQEFKNYIKGKKVAVVGVGVSNIPLIKFLVELGASVTAFDKNTEEKLGSIVAEFKEQGVEFQLGKNYLDKLTGFDVVFKTPSMRIDNKELLKAKEEGAYITSEMEEFVRYCKGKVYAVTGSDGKTTTTTIISKLLEAQGYKTWVGGNIGTPLFSKIEEIKEDHMVVLELSSFQLMTMNLPIDVAVVTNLAPNHLDMHKNMEEYINAKKNIFLHQESQDILVLNCENEITNSFRNEAKCRVRDFSSRVRLDYGASYENGILYLDGKEVCRRENIVIKGMHNVENFLAAFEATRDDVDNSTMRRVAETFQGVEHRCEFVREYNGVKVYNDSKATNTDASIIALKAFKQPVILLMGGFDKGLDLQEMSTYNSCIKKLVTFGAAGKRFKEDMHHQDAYYEETLKDAVNKAFEISEPGDIILLSPSTSSFDEFKGYEERGRIFKQYVNEK